MGNVTEKIVPSFSSLITSIFPLCNLTIDETMDKPSPEPSTEWVLEVSTR